MKWRKVIQLKNKNSIRKVENEFEIKFPLDFIELIIKHNAGIPIPSTFDTERIKGKDFGELLNFNLNESFNVIHEYNLIKNRIPEKVFPFAGDAGGNYLCFDFREDENDPLIRFWDHEMKFEIEEDRLETFDSDYEPDNYNLDFVANNLKELLANLYGEEDYKETNQFSDQVLDIFINTYDEEQLLELEDNTLNQINNRLIARGRSVISKNKKYPFKTYQGKDYTEEEWKKFEEERNGE